MLSFPRLIENLSNHHLWRNLAYNVSHDPFLIICAVLWLMFIILSWIVILHFHRRSAHAYFEAVDVEPAYGVEQLRYLAAMRLRLFKINTGNMTPDVWWAMQREAAAGRITEADIGRAKAERAAREADRKPELSQKQTGKQPVFAPNLPPQGLYDMLDQQHEVRDLAREGIRRTASSGISATLNKYPRPDASILVGRAARRAALGPDESKASKGAKKLAISQADGEEARRPLLNRSKTDMDESVARASPMIGAKATTSRRPVRHRRRTTGKSPLSKMQTMSETELTPSSEHSSAEQSSVSLWSPLESQQRPQQLSQSSAILADEPPDIQQKSVAETSSPNSPIDAAEEQPYQSIDTVLARSAFTEAEQVMQQGMPSVRLDSISAAQRFEQLVAYDAEVERSRDSYSEPLHKAPLGPDGGVQVEDLSMQRADRQSELHTQPATQSWGMDDAVELQPLLPVALPEESGRRASRLGFDFM